MALITTRATRKPFYVDAVRVTAENMPAVAEWCGGQIYPDEGTNRFIRVAVESAKNDRQTKAYAGDWVLQATNGFKVYTHKSYLNSFDELIEKPCGLTEHTADRKPCVLGVLHRALKGGVGCRSLRDYLVILGQTPAPATALDNDMGPSLTEACA